MHVPYKTKRNFSFSSLLTNTAEDLFSLLTSSLSSLEGFWDMNVPKPDNVCENVFAFFSHTGVFMSPLTSCSLQTQVEGECTVVYMREKLGHTKKWSMQSLSLHIQLQNYIYFLAWPLNWTNVHVTV